VQQSSYPNSHRVGFALIYKSGPSGLTGRRTRRSRLIGASDIEDIQYRAIGRLGSSALGDRFRQQSFELAEIGDLAANIVEMMGRNVPNLAA
jgi:hypothetical protein